jgi:ABC-type lipoprotein release transport system permease subunit
MIFTRVFWVDALERAIKTAAQFAVTLIGANQTPIFDLDVAQIAGVSATGFVVSVLTSIVSARRPGTISPASAFKEG